jgi:ubiquinone/menaquinone biosynthesis C-methylase UbiE
MPSPKNAHREHPSTYFVQDRGNKEELARLELQDRLVTASMGGVLPEQPDPARFARVLDVGCGTGGWLIELAKTAPVSCVLLGVDASGTLLEVAGAQAETAQVGERVEFRLMDALRMLEFPNRSFDLVNLRFGVSWLRTWDWGKFLQECLRVSRPDGIIRLTEAEVWTASSSPTHEALQRVALQALYQSGHLWTPEPDSVMRELPCLLRQWGLQQVQTRAYTLEYRAGTPECGLFVEDARHVFRVGLPFLRKWTQVSEDYEECYQQMLKEMEQPDFVATWKLQTAWGQVQP